MLAQNRDAKRKETMNQIRKLLAKERRTWQQLLTATKRSSATLGRFLEELIQQGEVKAYTDPKDRRITWYEPQKEKVEAQIGKFEAVKFIEGMVNPVYAHEEKNGKAIAVFSSGIDTRLHGAVQKVASQIAKNNLRLLRVPQMPGQKTAVVIMVKGKEGSE